MEVGDLITNFSFFDYEKSKIGIITHKSSNSYSIRWIYVPVYDEFSEFENKVSFYCIQNYSYNEKTDIALFPVVYSDNQIKVVYQPNEL